ncbi:autotransporter outer membrane beta-barrel domain-containing protein [Pseudomonas sp. GV071]|jgi:outer membrane autotransporter protein|uniref:autotransporter outer membrane beta-barrel domain-containing protein n=1 Tax=Pseudomonas sp. GV071 TaxID=2135754 RepID=UPI000D3A7D19|nr:autotransporter outer membrane beta-barrel domain-containing protein [Pseudomonas sp. GV071]PTQ69107.1 outer membrane autotransporter protein [Pseudomonas sp. GV071]
MKSSHTLLENFHHNPLAQAIGLILAGMLSLNVARAEAEDAVVSAAPQEQNLPSQASLDSGRLASPLTALRAGIAGIEADGSQVQLDNPELNAQGSDAIVVHASNSGQITLNGGSLTLNDNPNDFSRSATAILAEGAGSQVLANDLSIGGFSMWNMPIQANDGGTISLAHSTVAAELSMQANGDGSLLIVSAGSDVGSLSTTNASAQVLDSTVHGQLSGSGTSNLDVQRSLLDGFGAGPALFAVGGATGETAHVAVLDSTIRNTAPNSSGPAVELLGEVALTMQGGSIESHNTGLEATGVNDRHTQTISLDGVAVRVDNGPQNVGNTITGLHIRGNTQVLLQDSQIVVQGGDQTDFQQGYQDISAGLRLIGSDVSVTLDNSSVSARMNEGSPAAGVVLTGSGTTVNIVNGSDVSGQTAGIRARDDRTSRQDSSPIDQVVIDGSRVTGIDGPALLVSDYGRLDVTVQNGSSLDAGDGNLLTVEHLGTANLTVDGSTLNGTISRDTATETEYYWDMDTYDTLTRELRSTANVTLKNNAHWTGQGNNIDAMVIDADSRWDMSADSNVASLDHHGVIAFQPGGAYKTLAVEGDLSGAGTFAMNTDLAAEQGDLLSVGGSISGDHRLAVADSGREPGAANGQLRLVDGNGGDGQFTLAGRSYVDAGAFRYSLEQQGDDWFLRNTATADNPQPENLSNGANAALGNQAATATLWSAQMNALVKRLGELRMGEDNGGVWARGIGKTFEVDNGNSRGFDQSVVGMEIGADTAVVLDGGKLYVGGLVGTAQSDQDYGDGSSGTIDSKLIGAYATWLDDNGYYVDTVAKYNRMNNEVKTLTNTGEQTKGSYSTNGFAGDVEVGKHIQLQHGWFVEPQVELSYTHTEGANYTTSSGLKVQASDADSLQGRVGSLFGKTFKLENGMTAQPYAKASYVHEFAGDSSVKVNGYTLDNQIAGSRAEVGLGGILQVSEKVKVSLDVEHAQGESVEEPWAVNLGVRYLW